MKPASLSPPTPSMSSEVLVPLDDSSVRFSWRTFWKYTGPGWLMSLAYLDPGNLTADLEAGAQAGYQLIWVLLAAHILGLLLQVLAAKLAVVSGKALAENCRAHMPRPMVWILWAMSEIAIIGADVQEVIGTSIALKVLFGIDYWIGTLITAVDTFMIMGIHAWKGVRVSEAFIFTCVMTMMACFWANMIKVAPPAAQVFSGFIPSIKSYAVMQMVGLIGAVIMPHNLYLHSALLKSRKIDRSSLTAIIQANKYFTLDSVLALVVSFLINIALVASFSYGFFSETCAVQDMACVLPSDRYKEPGTSCQSAMISGYCQKIELDGAGDALSGLLGGAAKYVFAFGLLAAGQASTLTGTFSGQYVMEGFLDLKLKPWVRIVITRGIALGPAMIVALLRERYSWLSDMNEQLNVLQSIQLPFALLPLLYFSAKHSVMGIFKVSSWLRLVVDISALLIIAVNFFLLWNEIQPSGLPWSVNVLLVLVSVAYLYLCAECLAGGRLVKKIRRLFGIESKDY